MIRKIALVLIRAYQMFISPLLRPSCRFLPTCSSYAATCIERFGVVRGSALALRRISRCHPWGGSGYDPPPLSDIELRNKLAPKIPILSRMIKVWIGKY